MNNKDWTNDLRHKLEGHREDVSDDLWARIEHSLDKPSSQRKALVTPLRRWAAAAVATGIVAGAMLFWHYSGEPLAEKQDEAVEQEQTIPTPTDNEILSASNASTSPAMDEETNESASAPSTYKTAGLLAQKVKEDNRPAEKNRTTGEAEPIHTHEKNVNHVISTEQPSETDKKVEDEGKVGQQIAENAETNSKDVPSDNSVSITSPPHTITADKTGDYHSTNTAIITTPKRTKNSASFKLYASGPMSISTGSMSEASGYMADATAYASPQSYNFINSFFDLDYYSKSINTVSNIKTKHHRPIIVGISYKHPLGNRLWANGGLAYTRLHSEFTSQMMSTSLVEEQTLHYIGIPLSLGFTIWQKGHFITYGNVGGQADINVKSSLESNGKKQKSPHDRVQFSALAGLGAEYDISPNAGIFLEPQLKYYLDNGSDIDNYFKEKKLRVDLEIGFRIIY